MRYWVMRTDRRFVDEVIAPELHAGRLRQGWGYRPDQDLRFLRELCLAGGQLDEHQRATWCRNRRLLVDEDGSIAAGDAIVLPNVPTVGVWSIAEAAAGYEYEISPRTSDHGHVRSVSLMREGIDPHQAGVDARLRRSMRCQRSLWNIDGLGEAVDDLIRLDRPAGRTCDPLAVCMRTATGALWAGLQRQYGGAEFEEPIRLLLEELYDVVEYRGGAGERGADFICRLREPLGTEVAVAVQVKMWDGVAVDPHPLEQLRVAHASWPGITSGVVLTTAEGIDASFLRAASELERDIGMSVKVIAREELLRLLIRNLPTI